MERNQQDPFGKYAPEPQTTATPPAHETAPLDEVDTEKYGVGKPRRIIVRGTVAKNSGVEDKRE
jgi:hypothetical protein